MKEKLYLMLAVLCVLLGIYGLGHRAAKRANEMKRLNAERDALRKSINTKNEVRDEVDKMSNAGVHERLHTDWMRK
ncbi:hypothetical protein NM952_03075 [Pasteurella multocida subsp. multocida]|uniref:Uncharacterized protein n=1 Tax=Pasteurella multocida TaxID=747 RepID=A0A9X3ZKS9_PASMD|nr:hypothetical protein [Pasteurella multocida]MBF6980011.1 hypothetical protein [Pasteurella multocida]MBF6983896.1 hypothetical protein [Pasteurella multocida]MBF6985680.1 hypothetical protein [Pasteurella multocida]MDA5607388.1 hypothetical protein [Pasteurella multocida subsp. multocida]MDA5609694.1 hypothetical protein [Pasteurella multocida]